ncbi:hypothetical protein NQZ68_018646 [Dissostichus eleginoides]|nr:hypothetical protein NQZ68_018646 [Dissostichus eleginoides]
MASDQQTFCCQQGSSGPGQGGYGQVTSFFLLLGMSTAPRNYLSPEGRVFVGVCGEDETNELGKSLTRIHPGSDVMPLPWRSEENLIIGCYLRHFPLTGVDARMRLLEIRTISPGIEVRN